MFDEYNKMTDDPSIGDEPEDLEGCIGAIFAGLILAAAAFAISGLLWLAATFLL